MDDSLIAAFRTACTFEKSETDGLSVSLRALISAVTAATQRRRHQPGFAHTSAPHLRRARSPGAGRHRAALCTRAAPTCRVARLSRARYAARASPPRSASRALLA